jgi:serine/threonine protein kinase
VPGCEEPAPSEKDIKQSGIQAVTIQYRAPEILFGSADWGFPADVWAFGCFLAEMVTGKLLFKAADAVSLRFDILRRCGSVCPTGLEHLLLWPKMHPKFAPRPWEQDFYDCLGHSGVNLLGETLRLQPVQRITATALIGADYFDPCALKLLAVDGTTAFLGDRAPFNIVVGHVSPELLEWLRDDVFFRNGAESVARYDLFAEAPTKHNAKRQRLEGLPSSSPRKLQLCGYVGETALSSSLNGVALMNVWFC